MQEHHLYCLQCLSLSIRALVLRRSRERSTFSFSSPPLGFRATASGLWHSFLLLWRRTQQPLHNTPIFVRKPPQGIAISVCHDGIVAQTNLLGEGIGK